MFYSDSPILGRLLRFAGVGSLVTLAYMIITTACVELLHVVPLTASGIGFCSCLPFSYLGQKRITFRSRNTHRVELPRFFLTTTIAFCGSVGSMAVITSLGWNYLVAVLIAVVVVPLGNFIAMNMWVFRHHRDYGE